MKKFSTCSAQVATQKKNNHSLQQKRKANKREDTIRSLKTKVGFLVSRHGRLNVGDIGVELVRETIERPGTGPVTRNGVRRALSHAAGGMTLLLLDGSLENPRAGLPADLPEPDMPVISTTWLG